MTWNYRILKDKHGYTVVEVFYEKGRIISYTEPIMDYYETEKELKDNLNMMVKDIKNPVIHI